MPDKYTFGSCRLCNKIKALKNELCVECSETDIPDFLKDLINPNKENKNENNRI